MTDVINTDGSDTVGDAVSSLVIQLRWELPSAQARPFLVPSLFSVMNINDRRMRWRSNLVRVSRCIGMKHDRLCSCFTSLNAACLASSPNFLMPCLRVQVCIELIAMLADTVASLVSHSMLLVGGGRQSSLN